MSLSIFPLAHGHLLAAAVTLLVVVWAAPVLLNRQRQTSTSGMFSALSLFDSLRRRFTIPHSTFCPATPLLSSLSHFYDASSSFFLSLSPFLPNLNETSL